MGWTGHEGQWHALHGEIAEREQDVDTLYSGSIADAKRIAAKKGTELPGGAYVGRVSPASAAALAGLRPGDVIVELAGRPIHSDQDVHRVGADLRYDQAVELQFWRNGQTIATTVLP